MVYLVQMYRGLSWSQWPHLLGHNKPLQTRVTAGHATGGLSHAAHQVTKSTLIVLES